MNLLTTTAVLSSPERPSQGIDDILKAGFSNFIVDGSMYLPPDIIMRWDKKVNDQWIRNDIALMKSELKKRNIIPAAVSMPYASFEMMRNDYVDVLVKYSKLILSEFEEIGVRKFIVKPITINIDRTEINEINQKYYLALAEECKSQDTKILLRNGCYSVGAHLIRGMFTDPEQAIDWIDRLCDLDKSTENNRYGFCADIGAYNIGAVNIQDTLCRLGDKIDMVIVRDNNGQDDVAVMPFFGQRVDAWTSDFLGMFRGLREIRFDKDMVIDASTSIKLCPVMLRPQYLAFEKDVAEYIKWQIELETSLYKYENIVLFGAGNMCRAFMKAYGNKIKPLFTCDNNSNIWGTNFAGLEVKNPEVLKDLPDNTGVYICNLYYREIEEQLKKMGVKNIEFFNDEYLPSYPETRVDRNKQIENN